jgi:hypothetical protein
MGRDDSKKSETVRDADWLFGVEKQLGRRVGLGLSEDFSA